jgi:hypothetical protein
MNDAGILEAWIVNYQSAPFRLAEAQKGDTSTDALLCWVAMHIVAWLKAWKGLQTVRVSMIWAFDAEGPSTTADIDLVVVHARSTQQFKVKVKDLAPTLVSLVILKWGKGGEEMVWGRVGKWVSLPDGTFGIETLTVTRGPLTL